MNVRTEVDVRELDGQDLPPGRQLKVEVSSHWNRRELVILRVGPLRDHEVVAFDAEQLRKAIQNAQNTDR